MSQLTLKDKLYGSSMMHCPSYGIEAWRMKVEREVKLDHTRMSMAV